MEAQFSIRKDDRVQIVAGKEKGKSGKVLKVFPSDGRILVEKVNMVKRHVKPTQQNPQGGISEKESPVHYSNVLLFCGKCGRGVRHGHQFVDAKPKKGKAARAAAKDGTTAKKKQKIRICRKCGESLESA